MVKTFRSAREVMRFYFPEQLEKERIEQLSFFEQMQYRTDKLVEKLLEDFKADLRNLA